MVNGVENYKLISADEINDSFLFGSINFNSVGNRSSLDLTIV